jgi:hypothetical protein
MITKAQALALRHGDELHYTGNGSCQRIIGPRGGITYRITRIRVNGKCQVWKRKSERFKLLIKYGLRCCAYMNENNAHEYHLPEACNLHTYQVYSVEFAAQDKRVANALKLKKM